jgi:hypothetical protein
MASYLVSNDTANWDVALLTQGLDICVLLVPLPQSWQPPEVDPVVNSLTFNDLGKSLLPIVAKTITDGFQTSLALESQIIGLIGVSQLINPYLPGFQPTWWNGNAANPLNHTIANLEIVYGLAVGELQNVLNTGAWQGPPGVGSGPVIGFTPATTNAFKLLEPTTEYPSMCGVTSYNVVDGHFFLKRLPDPISENITKTVQGLADSFESKYEDMGIQSLVGNNDKADITNVVYQGEILSLQTSSSISTYTATVGGAKTGAFVLQGGKSHYDTTNVDSSGANSVIAIRVNDVRPFALKGLDLDHEAEFDFTNPHKPTNRDYVRHLAPEQQSRIAVIDSPADFIAVGGPTKVLVHYNAIDKTGQIMAGNDKINPLSIHSNSANDGSGMTFGHEGDASKWVFDDSGWLVVERTVPDANTMYYDNGTPRPLSDWLKLPYATANANNTYTPLVIHSPGGLVSIPTKNIEAKIGSHLLQINPTGDITQAPFINLENTPHAHMLRYEQESQQKGTTYSKEEPYGIPIAIPNTRTPVKQSRGAYHILNVNLIGKQSLADTNTYGNMSGSQRPVALEQFDIIDNILMSDRHLLLIHPKDRRRTNTLSTLLIKNDSETQYNTCRVELVLMRGRIEEIAPTSGEDGGAQGVVIRGRSQLMDVSESITERDLNIGEGFPIKEIGDIGSPVVSLTMGGLGQGGIDIKPMREEHPHLTGWKDKVSGSGNPSVRNDKQTSTYYASTRALVEIPLFPSMFYDVDKRIPASTSKRSALPTSQSMEMVLDCTMTAINRPTMREYESRYAVDWGLRSNISALRLNDYPFFENVCGLGGFTLRCMRENAATFTKPSAAWSAAEDTCAIQANTAAWAAGDAYIEVDSVLPFVYEGGWPSEYIEQPTTPPGSTYSGVGDATWVFHAPTASPDGSGFIVTVGEGILGEMGIRLHIWKIAIVGTSHRLYFGRYHNPLDEDAKVDPTHANWIGNYIISGLPVVLGGWLTNSVYDAGTNDSAVAPLYTNLDDLKVVGSSASALLDNLALKIEYLFGMKNGTFSTTQRVMYDPTSPTDTILIHNGPSMEGMMLDPGYHLWSADDKPIKPFIECISSYLSLKGKKKDTISLDYVRPMRVNLGEIGLQQDKFGSAVDELIRRINQAGHPNAMNSLGGSAFNPPPLFTGGLGVYTQSSTDTGSHMGYIRAFRGDSADSRDGEGGLSIVIHCTIPGATGRNFAVWFNNKSPYPYTPTQVIGTGGLLATNSRSYQINSFPAPLPLGMDGETHIPITTFQGGVHGAVELNDELRTYHGIGNDFTFTTVRFPREMNDFFGAELEPILPDYNPDTQSVLWVERKVLDIAKRTHRSINSNNPGIILVDDKYLATFDGIATGFSDIRTKESGPGSCAALHNVQPLYPKEKDKFTELFYDQNGFYDVVSIKIIDPLVDTQGILFFGGGHTGVTFDVSDGTANDYTNFYTHHYAKGPTGYAGFQNLQEVQTSAAVLDFTHLKNEDTIKDNSYAGMHYKDDGCIAYIRMNKPDLGDQDGSGGHNFDTTNELPTWKNVENKYNLPIGMGGDWAADLENAGSPFNGEYGDNAIADQSEKPLYLSAGNHGDISARGVEKTNATGYHGLVLTKIADKATLTSDVAQQALPTSPPAAKDILASGPWSITFCVKPNDTTTSWGASYPIPTGFAYGNGPILHGIDSNGKPWGVSVVNRQADQGSAVPHSQYDYRIIVHHVDTAVGGNIMASFNATTRHNKADWAQVTVVKPLDGNPVLYVDGIPLTLYHEPDTLYVGGYELSNDPAYGAGIAGNPRLKATYGIGLNASPTIALASPGMFGRHYNLITIGVALHGVPMCASGAGLWAGIKELSSDDAFGGVGDSTYGVTKTGTSGCQTGGMSDDHVHYKGQLAEVGLWNKEISVSDALIIGAKNWD